MKRVLLLSFAVWFSSYSIFAQSRDTSTSKTLEDCIRFALANQTGIRQSLIDEEITEREIKVRLSDWYPQINFSGNYQNNFQRPTSIFNNSAQQVGTYNASAGYFGLNQTLFNRDAVIASQSAKDVRLNTRQATINVRIETVANVSKAS